MADINFSKKISVNFIKSKMPLIQNEIKDIIINRFLKIISLQEKELYQLRFDSKYFKELAQKTLKQIISGEKEKEPEKKTISQINNSLNSGREKGKNINKKNITKPMKKSPLNNNISSNDIMQCNSVCIFQKNKKLIKEKERDFKTIKSKRTNRINKQSNNSKNKINNSINNINEKKLIPSLSTTDTYEYNDIKIHNNQKKILNIKMAPSNSQSNLPIYNKINNINKNKDYLITENLSSQNNLIKKERVKNSHSIKNFRELFEHSSFLQDEKRELQNKNIRRIKNLSQASFTYYPVNNSKVDCSYNNINTLQNSIISPQVTRTQKILKSLSNSARKGIRINTLDNAKLNSFLGKL